MFHDKIDLMDILKDIPEVVVTPGATFSVNWETMKVSKSAYCPNEVPGSTPHVVKSFKFQNIEKIVEFVKNNKHQIVIWACFIPSYTEEIGTYSDPRPIMRYAKRPGSELI